MWITNYTDVIADQKSVGLLVLKPLYFKQGWHDQLEPSSISGLYVEKTAAIKNFNVTMLMMID